MARLYLKKYADTRINRLHTQHLTTGLYTCRMQTINGVVLLKLGKAVMKVYYTAANLRGLMKP